MSFPQSLSGNPEDKRIGFRVKHGMTGIREFSGKVSNSKSQVPSFRTPNCSLFNKKGFTLIETIMAIVIIAILAAVVVLRNPFDSIKLSSATKKVAGDIRYAQKLAISTQQRCGIFFISDNSYRIFENNNAADPAISSGDTCSDNSGNFEVDFSAGRCSNYNGVTFTATPTIYFNSIGAPDSAATITLDYKGSTENINIEAGTGRVSY